MTNFMKIKKKNYFNLLMFQFSTIIITITTKMVMVSKINHFITIIIVTIIEIIIN